MSPNREIIYADGRRSWRWSWLFGLPLALGGWFLRELTETPPWIALGLVGLGLLLLAAGLLVLLRPSPLLAADSQGLTLFGGLAGHGREQTLPWSQVVRASVVKRHMGKTSGAEKEVLAFELSGQPPNASLTSSLYWDAPHRELQLWTHPKGGFDAVLSQVDRFQPRLSRRQPLQPPPPSGGIASLFDPLLALLVIGTAALFGYYGPDELGRALHEPDPWVLLLPAQWREPRMTANPPPEAPGPGHPAEPLFPEPSGDSAILFQDPADGPPYNLLDNPSFEQPPGKGSTPWRPTHQAPDIQTEWIRTPTHTGNRALSIQGARPAVGWPGWQAEIPHEAGRGYTFSVRYRTPDGAKPWLEIGLLDADGHLITSYSTGCRPPKEQNSWFQSTLRLPPERFPSNTARIRPALRLCFSGIEPTAIRTLYLDDVALGPMDTPLQTPDR